MSEKVFASGFYFNEPHGKAPDFVLGNVSIRPDQFIPWLQSQKASEKGYVRISIKRSQGGKVYAELDTWEPEVARTEDPGMVGDAGSDIDDDIPF